MKYVIIGASAAGAQAGEELRRIDKDASITVISSEKHIPYSRCLISRFVDGRLKKDNLYFKTKSFFDNNNIEGVLGVEITKIDRTAKKVISKDNREFEYDKLLIATGSSPWVPKIDGLGLKGIYSFHSLNDANEIIEKMDKIENAVIIGAGFVGLEAAYALARQGKKVTVVEKASQILPNQMDVTGSLIIQKDLEELGVNIILNESITSINGDDSVQSVTLPDKTTLSCDILIIATGMRSNIKLALDTGLKTDRGIIVDEFLRTSDPDIYAAGDVIEIDDVSTGRRIPSATWFNAVLQGKFAGRNMAGLEVRYSHGIGIQNAVQFHQIPAISFGKTQLITEEEVQEYDVMSIHKDKLYKKLILKDGKLCGMIFVGDIAKSGFYTALIRYGVDISEHQSKLLDNDFSYAYFKEEDFGQYSPYAESNSVWEQPDWWSKRVQYIEG